MYIFIEKYDMLEVLKLFKIVFGKTESGTKL